MPEPTDRLLSGRYRLIEEIGRGGMGTVWWAHDEQDDREVAVKEVHLPPSLDHAEQVNLVKRTRREALAAGKLHHPGLVTIREVIVEEARPWLIMEYVAGRSLEDVFTDDGPISPARVADIGRQLLSALRAAHDAGIVHRDVKPSNVLLEGSGRVVLTDFGIATYEGATTLTQSGTFMGSPAYVAPEVARGERATPASDLWSLGATLYAAVEGRPPYDFDTAMATLSALVSSEPDPPERAGPLRPVLDGLLRKEPSGRLSHDEVEELLHAVTSPEPAPPDRPGFLARLSQSFLTAVVGGAAVVGLAAGGIALYDSAKSDSSATTSSPSPSAGRTSASPSASPTAKAAALPKTAEVDTTSYQRVLTRSGTYPAETLVTLTVRDPGDSIAVAVACKGGTGRLAFSYRVFGYVENGTCGRAGGKPRLVVHTFHGTARGVTLTVRILAGTAGSGVKWTAAAYTEAA